MTKHTAGEQVSVIERTRRPGEEPFGVELIRNEEGEPCAITIARDCTEDDAHRFVICWNSHDALVGLLEKCAKELDSAAKYATAAGGADHDAGMWHTLAQEAKQALKQAKGE